MQIFTASWFAKLPPTVQRIGVSRGTPRGQSAGYRMLRELAPGPWFKSVTPRKYLDLYNEQLAALDPAGIVDRLNVLGEGKDVAMLCFESAKDCHSGAKWCHRHIAARWLGDTLGITVLEFDVPDLDPWALLRANGITPPSYSPQGRAQVGPPIDLTNYLGRTSTDPSGALWKVIGPSADHPDQAEIQNATTGELRAISADTLKKRFGEQPSMI